jgi:hypothetical protein
MVSVSIDLSQFENVFGKLPGAIEDELRIEMKNQLVLLQEEARNKHRYESHTRKLEQSVQWKVSSDDKVGTVYLEDSIANYGIYVAKGHGTWAPDNFMEDALAKREGDIRKGFEDAVQKGLRKAGV